MKRLVAKAFIAFVNTELERIGLGSYRAIEVNRTHYNSDQYESGAAKLIVNLELKEDPSHKAYFNCWYFLGEYADYINQGYKMQLVSQANGRSKFYGIQDLEVEVYKNFQ